MKAVEDSRLGQGKCTSPQWKKEDVLALDLTLFCVYRSVVVKRMFRSSDEDLCPSPHKQIKEEAHKRGTSTAAFSYTWTSSLLSSLSDLLEMTKSRKESREIRKTV